MKQVTGSNPTSITDKVSIQLPLDGLLFIGDSIPNCKVEDGGVVEVDFGYEKRSHRRFGY